MNEGRRLGLPPLVLVLDVVGTVLVAAGLFARFGGSDAPAWRFLGSDGMSAFLIVAGVACMVPLLLVIASRAQQRSKN